MKEYLEQQLKQKAHELMILTLKVVGRVKKNRDLALTLRRIISRIPAAIFEGQSRDFPEDKLKYFLEARNAVFEAKYYLDLLYNNEAISYYSYQRLANRITLLDKILFSRIRSIDKREKVRDHKLSIRTKYYLDN